MTEALRVTLVESSSSEREQKWQYQIGDEIGESEKRWMISVVKKTAVLQEMSSEKNNAL